ncbi:tumor necrosis factor receptor superfamily member 9 isoform X1 [Cricetulus griseus]|uniref:Tumor necrosis factor receptor superfamily member 9 isoform X1 n=1 Tax=Cricetulus griseus TaxID=10029 RepID=A0A9J7JB93_CRIGR|nr:tumor necrosis factor receptor superfamily member 9 isoform X1 [Cricetulus griseus]XP_027254114.1 tumor necrosis factor receptor superfamily member 9 isoform X1 [Cricetulus griseus]
MRDFAMGNGCYNMVVTVLLVVGAEKTRALRDSCEECEAGTFCKKENPVCTSCPPSTYSSKGGQPYCNICRVCEGYFRFKKPCSPTSNAECECTEGLHCLGPKCAWCEKDCKPGQELTNQGCKNCDFGTFNDQSGGGTCRPWTNCSLDGKLELKKGTKETDVVCGPTPVSFSPGTPTTTVPVSVRKPGEGGQPLQVLTLLLALTSAMLLFLLFVILGLLVVKWGRRRFPYVLKQPFKVAIPMAQEEDACSCRFPEEEEGGGYEL